MAKDDGGKNDGDGQKIDGESRECLDQVKKGKLRKFVMICKGASIVSLVVYKKGSVDKYKKQAKEGGTGQICFGVVTGKGLDINFQLARSDGFEKEPVKTTVLRHYMEEVAEFKCKPLFEIVNSPSIVLDEDDPLVQRFLKLQAAALSACDTHPERAGEINSLCVQIGGRLDQELLEQAEAGINQLEALLQSLANPPSSGTTAPEKTPEVKNEPSSDPNAAQKLADTLKTLKPLIDKAIEQDPSRKNNLFQSMTQIAGEIKQGLFDDAKTHLVVLAKQVQGYLAQKTPETTVGPDPAKQKYESLRKQLEPLLNEARRANPEKSNGLLNLWNYAIDQADAANFNNAVSVLGKLEEAIRKALAEAPKKDTDRFGIREGIVAERRQQLEEFFKKRVADIQLANESDVNGLRVAIEEQSPDEENPGKIEDEINSALEVIYTDMRATLLDSLATESVDAVLKAVQECREKIDNDELIRHLMTAQDSLSVEVRFQDRFDELFDEVLAEVSKDAVA
ncbi:MAG: hypothetical protein K8U03_14760 [Planctomycetia bacterium]|nr:hypothetical protein [Planctomycetia bacterium]